MTYIPQDLHIHTTFSRDDGAIVPEQTVEFVSRHRYAARTGVSDHLDYVAGEVFETYETALRRSSLYVGIEVNGAEWVQEAYALNVDYFVYHCRDRMRDYRGAELLLETEKPVIIAHPNILDTNLARVPPGCYLEINNRYIWRSPWNPGPLRCAFGFVFSSDAHQPHWLNQNIARSAGREMAIEETLLFPENHQQGNLS